jgi:hypothetical protein
VPLARPPLTLVPPEPVPPVVPPAAAPEGAAGTAAALGITPLVAGLGAAAVVTFWPAPIAQGSCEASPACVRATQPRVNLDVRAVINATQLDNPWQAIAVNAYLLGKHKVITYTALSEFFHGGPGSGGNGPWDHAGFFERTAALIFLSDVELIRDNPSSRVMNLFPDSQKSTKALGAGDKVIFGTGDTYHWQTVTTDWNFYNAATFRGVVLDIKVFDAAEYAGK